MKSLFLFYPSKRYLRFTHSTLTVLLSTCFLSAHAAPLENKFTASTLAHKSVSGIRHDEIFQRELPQNSARITIRLNSQISPITYSYYSISLLDDRGMRQSVLSEGYYNGNSLLSFSLSPQNKFKKVRLSFYDRKSDERLRWDSPSFNVGEVFIIAGQSNAANHGEASSGDFKANELVRVVDPSNPDLWIPLKDEMPYATTWGAPRNGSPWATFANELGTKLASRPRYGDVVTIPIGLINVAYGGSSLEVWDPSARMDQNGNPIVLFDRLILAASSLKRYTPTNGIYSCGYRAMLWHQGESNSNRDFNSDKKSNAQEPSRQWYANKLKYIAQSFNNRTGCTQPWMIAKASWLAPHWRKDAKLNPNTKFNAELEIREGQSYLTKVPRLNNSEPLFYAGPDTDLLAGDNPAIGGRKAYRSDGVHMNHLGLKLHGRLWASYIANMIDPINQTFQTEKDLIPEVAVIYNLYLNVLGRSPQEINMDSEGLRYWTQMLILNPDLQDDIYYSFLNSDELYLKNVFRKTVGRNPSWWEIVYWLNELYSKRTTRENLAGADKVGFENTLSVNGKKIFRLYVNTLGRTLPDIKNDLVGLTYWTNILNYSPSAESAVVATFSNSEEYRVRSAFVKSKGRQPTNVELNHYISQVAYGSNEAVLINSIFNNTNN